MKQTIKRILVIGGNCLVAVMLVVNLYQLYRAFLSARSALGQQLLSTNPDLLLNNINSTFPAVWLWIVSGVGLAGALFVLIGWFIPKLRHQLWFWRLNFIWLLAWIAYLIFAIIVLFVLVNSVLNGGQ